MDTCSYERGRRLEAHLEQLDDIVAALMERVAVLEDATDRTEPVEIVRNDKD